jgi:hypothetical protein
MLYDVSMLCDVPSMLYERGPAMILRVTIAVLVVLGLSVSVDGQGIRRGEQGQQPKTEPFEADGTVQAIGPGRIQMLTTSNQNWMIFVAPDAVIHVTGTALPDFVRPGMFIRFDAELDKKGNASEKLKELTLFTPSPRDPVGIWPEGTAPIGDAAQKNAAGPMGGGGAGGAAFGGGGAAVGGGAAFGGGGGAEIGVSGGGGGGGRNAGGVAGGAAAGGPAPTSARYTVAGRIGRVRNGRLTIQAGNEAVSVMLDEAPTIQVDMADCSVVKQNDRIAIKRGKMFAGRLGVAQAQEMTIELAEPLTSAKKKPVRQPPAGSPRRPNNAEPAPFNPNGGEAK